MDACRVVDYPPYSVDCCFLASCRFHVFEQLNKVMKVHRNQQDTKMQQDMPVCSVFKLWNSVRKSTRA